MALQLGHRISVDLDFFTKKKFNEKALSLQLNKISVYKEEGKSWQTVWGRLGKTKFSIFYYKYPLLEKTSEFEGVQVADKSDISAMKINALEERGTKRDFIDVYFLSKELSLDRMLEFYNKKYGNLDEHLYSIVRALSYFEEAENEKQDPKMLKEYDWEKVKEFFTLEAQRLWKSKQT